jgi:glycosyltransferase involved in cell wall biosynthesis
VRIGYDAKRLFNNFTGLGNYSRFIVGGLAKTYPDNEYWLYSPRMSGHPETEPFRALPFRVREPHNAVDRAFPSFWRSVRLGAVAQRDGVQIFHGLSNELPSAGTASLKSVLTVHDLIYKRFPAYYNYPDRVIYDVKLKRSIKRADKIVAISHQTASDLREFEHVDNDRLVVIQQGCQSAFQAAYSDSEVDQVKSKYGLPDQFVLCVGTMEPRKNAALLIRALSMMSEKVFVVIAGKPTPYAEVLREMVRQKKLESSVRFIYHTPYSDLPLLYRAASLFVYPSVFEGFGIPIVEAIASQVPVIAASGSSLAEAGGPNCMYVNPTNPEELAVTISQVLGDEQLRKTMISKSSEYIRRFEPEPIAEQMMRVYREL